MIIKKLFKKVIILYQKKEKEIQTEQLKALPNFDKDIFEKISWIHIE